MNQSGICMCSFINIKAFHLGKRFSEMTQSVHRRVLNILPIAFSLDLPLLNKLTPVIIN